MNKKIYLSDVCNDRNNNLDFIRFFAAVMVLYSHAFPLSRGNEGELLKDITNGRWSFGSLAVAIFFVISGFLITQSYDKTQNPIVYLKARILRIFPALAVVLLLSVFVLGPIFTTLNLRGYFSNSETYIYLKNIFLFPLYWNLPGVFENNIYSSSINGSLWTIPLEFYFYIVVLILGIFKLLTDKKINILLYISFIYLYIFRTSLFPIEGHFMSLPKYSLLELGIYFFVGMCLYTYKEYIVLDKHVAMMAIVVLIFSILQGEYVVSFSIFGTYLIFYTGFNQSIKFSGFSKYGDFSYGVYIFGFPVQQAITSIYGGVMNPYLNFFLSLVITLPLAILSWHFVEKRFLRFKKVKFIKSNFLKTRILLSNIEKSYLKLLEHIQKLGWITFCTIFIISSIGISYYYKRPSVITFPYKNDVIFSEGWLPQSSNEDYRWISKSGSVQLRQEPQTEKIGIQGFIPENFNEINYIKIFIDDMLIAEQELISGQPFNIIGSLSKNKSSISKTINLRIELNDVHRPFEGEQDIRELSALINKIYIY